MLKHDDPLCRPDSSRESRRNAFHLVVPEVDLKLKVSMYSLATILGTAAQSHSIAEAKKKEII